MGNRIFSKQWGIQLSPEAAIPSPPADAPSPFSTCLPTVALAKVGGDNVSPLHLWRGAGGEVSRTKSVPLARGMRASLFIIVLIVCGLQAAAQKKNGLPREPQTIPNRDSVITVDKIAAGTGKRFHWHSGYASFCIDKPARKGSYVDVMLNGKTILSRHAAPNPKPKARRLLLKNGTNTLVIKPSRSNKIDSFALNISLYETGMHYNITAQMKKGKSDTMIIIKH